MTYKIAITALVLLAFGTVQSCITTKPTERFDGFKASPKTVSRAVGCYQPTGLELGKRGN